MEHGALKEAGGAHCIGCDPCITIVQGPNHGGFVLASCLLRFIYPKVGFYFV